MRQRARAAAMPLLAASALHGVRGDSTFPLRSRPALADQSIGHIRIHTKEQDTGVVGDFTRANTGAAALRERYQQLAQESAESVANPALAAYSGKRLFKPERYHVEKDRKVIVVVGLTGSGKSSTGNTLCGARRAFQPGDSVASVTSAVSVRDYSFGKHRWRVIDTPGFGDTNLSEEQIARELRELFKYAKYGLTAVVVVVKKGRFTQEQETVVRRILDLFGGDSVLPYAMVAVTRSAEPQEKLLDDIGKLPMDHALRRLSTLVEDRVLPVENVKEPAKGVCRLLLHHGVLEILEQNNGDTFKPEAGTGVSLLNSSAARSSVSTEANSATCTLPDGTRCTVSVNSLQRRVTTMCDFPH